MIYCLDNLCFDKVKFLVISVDLILNDKKHRMMMMISVIAKMDGFVMMYSLANKYNILFPNFSKAESIENTSLSISPIEIHSK